MCIPNPVALYFFCVCVKKAPAPDFSRAGLVPGMRAACLDDRRAAARGARQQQQQQSGDTAQHARARGAQKLSANCLLVSSLHRPNSVAILNQGVVRLFSNTHCHEDARILLRSPIFLRAPSRFSL